MKVLLTGPNIYDTNRLGGIITVANTILALFPEMEYFARSGAQGKGKLTALLNFTGILRAFKKRVRRGDLDLVHINSALERTAIMRDILFVRMTKNQGIPVILHLHGGKFLTYSPDPVTERLIRYILHHADQIIVLGQSEKDQLSARYGLKNIHILRNALDLSSVPAGSPKLKRSPLRLTYLGRIDHYKGLEDILTALKGMQSKGVPFEYHLYGNGPFTDEYRTACRDALAENFRFGGVVLGEDKWKALDESDIFLLPSLYEGLPMSLLEAMAVGCLCITTPVGSIPEVITDQENGILVDKENPSLLQKTLEQVVEAPERYAKMAAAGRDTVRRRFNGQVYKEALENIYRQT